MPDQHIVLRGRRGKMSERMKVWRDLSPDEPLRQKDEWFVVVCENLYGGQDGYAWIPIPRTWVGRTTRGLKQYRVRPFRRSVRSADV